MIDDLSKIHPVNFFNDKVQQNENIGGPELYPILKEIQHMSTKDTRTTSYIDPILKDFIINNITNLSNTFIIKLLEDYIDKDEIAYLVDFNDKYDIKMYLYDALSKSTLATKDEISLCNIIESNIIFTINQFIQFYVIYKMIYKEGVDLYKYIYKATYDENKIPEMREQDKYVFCVSIMNNMLENMLQDIHLCCTALKVPILNIKLLSKGGN